MIDFHSHILPQMDDGSSSVDESIQMLKLSFSMGVDTIISTPHYYSSHETIEDFLKRRSEKHQLLMNEIKDMSDVPEIIMGAEVAYFSGMNRNKDIGQLCIENTKYLLLEMPFHEWSSLCVNAIKGLITTRGIIPIIAHLDAYLHMIQHNDAKLKELLSLGVIFQANCEALLSKTLKHTVLKMIDRNQIHLLGSDCHNMSDRVPNLDFAKKIISKKLGKSSLERIDSNGRSVVGA